jgi:hypothetical protein
MGHTPDFHVSIRLFSYVGYDIDFLGHCIKM